MAPPSLLEKARSPTLQPHAQRAAQPRTTATRLARDPPATIDTQTRVCACACAHVRVCAYACVRVRVCHLPNLRCARSRLVVREQLDAVRTYSQRHKEVKRKPWKLEESIWAPRREWCDSRWFWETEKAARKMLQTDWDRALKVGLGAYITRHDAEAAQAGDGSEEVQEVFEVIWMHQPMVYVLFDVYAALGTSCAHQTHTPTRPPPTPSPRPSPRPRTHKLARPPESAHAHVRRMVMPSPAFTCTAPLVHSQRPRCLQHRLQLVCALHARL